MSPAGDAPPEPASPGPLPELPQRGAVLAVDYGARRVGVAVGDLELRMAHALAVLEAEGGARQAEALAPFVDEWRPALLVVGLPTTQDGTEHPLASACRNFARRLQQRFDVPALMVDEALTSWAAESDLREAGVRPGQRKGRLDALAAAAILETFFADPQLSQAP